MKITEQQIAALESLTCERLSSNVSNLREIEAFDNNRNENLVYALKNQAFAGIELVHFCSNTDKVWKCPGSHQKIGAIVFWYFIVPKVLAVMKLVGCEYLFLFAADFTEDEELVNYYKTAMSFSEPEGKKTLMPLYDLSCKLLYQETSELERKQAYFFDNFNPDEDAI